MTLIEKLYSWICKLAIIYWWPNWSNHRWKDSIRKNIVIDKKDIFYSIGDLQVVINNVYKAFKYTKDGVDQLYDSITPPPQNYQNYLDGSIKDDCDGFHSTIYHIIKNQNVECYLMTVNSIGAGHCVLIMHYNEKWTVIDYTKIYQDYDTAQDAIDAYNINFSMKYKAGKVLYNGFVSYDYDSGKFKSEHIV